MMNFWNKVFRRLGNNYERHYQILYELHQLRDQVEDMQIQLGTWRSKSLHSMNIKSLHEAEFKVFSQWGEDGIIQHLIQQVPIANDIFIEFGVQDYRESNTRFLLAYNNWRGLIIDGSATHIDFIRGGAYSWRYDLDAVSAFITRDNINQIISSADLSGDIGLLSIDVDGMDYWIWETINIVSPRIVVIEYNSLFGAEYAITIPYKAEFVASKEHYSGLYSGASLAAVTHLGNKKGYQLIGSNRAGNNAFFVREDVLGQLTPLKPEQGYFRSRFRTARDKEANLSRLRDHSAQLKLIAHLPVDDVLNNRTLTIGKLFDLN
jgi:hypothetical protein